MNFKELLEDYSFTQTAFAKEFNIPLRTVQDWVSQKRTPPQYVFDMIVKLLEISYPKTKD